MKAKTKKKITTRTAAFLVMAILLLVSAAVVGAKTVADIQSAEYKAEFELSNLDVSLMENGTPVSDPELDYVLLTPLDGQYKPGYLYKEAITAKNNGDINVFLRINIRKYRLAPAIKNTVCTGSKSKRCRYHFISGAYPRRYTSAMKS